jgi:3-hydroxybutyryl-CoA dehydrogenase
MNVAIIGAGPLGRWLALAAARAGYSVLLEDVMPANLHHAQEYIRQQYTAATPDPESPNPEPGSLTPVLFVTTIEDAVRNADLVIDCVPDELESKLEILFLLDRMCPPHTVLATPTTRLSIADLASCTYRPGQCVAIAVEARDLTAASSDQTAPDFKRASATPLLLRTTSQTTVPTMSMLHQFWYRLGFAPQFELDPAG